MLTDNKTMDVPRHVLRTLFRDSKFPLIQHHIDSYNDMLDTGIPTFVRVSNPHVLELKDRYIRVYIGGKDASKIRYIPPKEEDGFAIMPHTCRLDNRTYALTVEADIDVEYEFADKSVETKTFTNVVIGQIPLMLRSRLCYLSAMDGYEVGECKFELGGYFIIDGAEKVLLTQELLGNNMFYTGERKRRPPRTSAKGLVEREDPLEVKMGDASYEEDTEHYTGIRTLSEDGARGPYSHFLVLPSETIDPEDTESYGRDRRLATITVPGFGQPVPVISLFRALGLTSHRDIYEITLIDVPDKNRIAYDDMFRQIFLSHERHLRTTEMTDLDILVSQCRSKSRAEVVKNLYDMLFTHVEGSQNNTGALLRRKAYLLGHMLRSTMDVAMGSKPESDRDNMQFKRLKTSGILMFEEFRRIFRDLSKSMISQLDEKITYNSKTYAGKGLTALIEAENINRFWRKYRMLNEYLKSFKGAWDGRVGISQELGRPSYAAVVHHLRKTDLQIDKSTSTAPPRRLYASQFGIMCPVDSPDGSDIGYKKALSLFAQVTTAFPSAEIRALLLSTGAVRFTEDIHPSTWQPTWSKVFINSDLVGACIGNTEEVYTQLLNARRTGVLGKAVSLAWNRLNNEFRIYSDDGRPIRPVYREGVRPEQVLAARTWADIVKLMDYMDAAETDSCLVSMTPFHKSRRSEIHMSFNMSALANLVPYPDHNPGPRNAFSIAQQKQAASWYHTNYMKRFDTIAMMATNPQKPISQTWLYNEMMGKGGCMAYGENALVAVTMYGGHNQEDSVILNEASLKRGMYHTMYYHSYDHAEDMLDPATNMHTEIRNPLKEESIKRKDGYDYSMLDADGFIRADSTVTDTTVLVGMVAPIVDSKGQITGYRDISITPKRGQHGRIDAVYRYSTESGLRGVKIRIAEYRIPQIGDKMASRHSQKGTVGMIMSEEDMPFTAKGVRPDLIFNPHGIPTRMTVGQFLEAMSNKLGVEMGTFVDATPFTTTNRIGDLRVELVKRGFEPYGSEVLYNGETGEMMESEIFMGPIYYQRLKHMVEDKINYRSTGPKKPLTQQPTQGRGDEGGLRIGEMERDALISHGMSKFINESLMERSDKAERLFDKEEGRLGTSRDTLVLPYSMGLFAQELEAMHLTVKVETE